MAKPAATQKVLPIERPADADPEAAKRAKDAADVAAVAAKEAERKAQDPISDPLNYGPYVTDHSPTMCFGRQVIEDYGGDVGRIPKYRFKRWYFRDKVVIDTFITQLQYDSADVEGRRAMCKKYGHRYAALGPDHHILPQSGQKFPSQIEQLGIGR